jgi:hypothetical protein
MSINSQMKVCPNNPVRSFPDYVSRREALLHFSRLRLTRRRLRRASAPTHLKSEQTCAHTDHTSSAMRVSIASTRLARSGGYADARRSARRIGARQLESLVGSRRRSAIDSSIRSTNADGESREPLKSSQVLNASAQFAYAWVAFGYVLPSALAGAVGVSAVDPSGAGISSEDARALAGVLFSCESAKLASTLWILSEVGGGEGGADASTEKQLETKDVVARGAQYGVTAAVAARLIDFSTSDGENAVNSASLFASGDATVVALTVASSCLVAPYLEEAFFRRFLFEDLRRRVGSDPAAIALSSLLFAGAHFSVDDFASLAVCGACFALAARSAGGFPAAFLAHALYNASVFVETAVASSG